MNGRSTLAAEKTVTILGLLRVLMLLAMPATALATIKGLSQIVTPDLQEGDGAKANIQTDESFPLVTSGKLPRC